MCPGPDRDNGSTDSSEANIANAVLPAENAGAKKHKTAEPSLAGLG